MSSGFHTGVDRAEFRSAVLRYVKYLVRARWMCDPGFLSDEDLSRWGLQDIADERYQAWQLLEMAAKELADINQVIERCGTGGVSIELDLDSHEGRIANEVAFLAESKGGAPYYNAALKKASERLQNQQPIVWSELVNWSQLGSIRDDLDQLWQEITHAGQTQQRGSEVVAESDRVTLFQWGSDPIALVDGHPKERLTAAQFDVIQSLLEAGGRLSLDELKARSGHPSAADILRDLRSADADWGNVISTAGRAGHGYGIK